MQAAAAGINQDGSRDNTDHTSSDLGIDKLAELHMEIVQDIWTLHVLVEACENDHDVREFENHKHFFQGLADDHPKKWETFLDRYHEIKVKVKEFETSDHSTGKREELKKCLQQVRKNLEGKVHLSENATDATKGTKTLLTSPLDLKNKKVIKGNEKLADDYQEVVRENLLKDFPDILAEVRCFPPLIDTQKKAEKKPKNKENEAEGIIRVVKMLQTTFHDEDKGNPAVILTRYKFDDFLKYLKDVKTTEEECDFDILVLSKHGFITVEVKACKSDGINLKKRIYKGRSQRSKCCKALKELFRDRPDILEVPVCKFIATPFVDGKTVSQLSAAEEEPREKNDENYLTSDDLQNEVSFKEWFHKVFPNFLESNTMNDDQYLTIVERFIGFGSAVETKLTLEDVMSAEGYRHFCPKLTNKQREIVEADERFVAVAGDYGTGKSLILVKRANRLVSNPDENVKVIVVTCPDISVSGVNVDEGLPRHMINHLKTLLISSRRSRQSSGEQEDPINPQIRFETFCSFLGKTGSSSEEVACTDKISENILVKAVENELKNLDRDAKLHLLLDEVPFNFLRHPCFSQFFKWLSCNAPKSVNAWFTISTHSYRCWINSDDSTSWLEKFIDKSCKFFYLQEVQRTPKLVYNLQKEISKYCGDSHPTEFSRWAWEGSMPCLYRVPHCSCPDKSKPLACLCAKERLACTLRAIFQRVKPMEDSGKVKSIQSWPVKVAIILSNVECPELETQLLTLVEDCCNQLNVRITNELRPSSQLQTEQLNPGDADDYQETSADKSSEDGDDFGISKLYDGKPSNHHQNRNKREGDKILLTRDTYYIGCERHIIICIDPNAMKHWFKQSRVAYTSLVISRTLSAYIHLTFQDDEANQMFKMNMEAAMRGRDQESCRKIDEALQQCEQNKCMQTLLDEYVIEEMTVEWNHETGNT